MLALVKETFKVDGKIDLKVMKPGEVVPMEDDEGQEIIGVVVEVAGHGSRISTTPWQALTCTLKVLWWPSIDGLATARQRILQQT